MTVPMLKLADCITLTKGKPSAAMPYFGDDAEPYLSPEYLRGRGMAEPAKPAANGVRVKDGDTILLWDGSNAGEVFRARAGLLASTMTHIRHGEVFEPEYFCYAAKRWEAYLKGQTSGSGIPHVDKEVFGKLEILKLPSYEQKLVAHILNKLDRAIEQTEALIAKQQRIKTGLMQDLLTKGVDAHGNIRSEATHAFKDSPLGRIPVEWEVQPLEKLADVDRGKFTHRPRNDPNFYGGEFPFIQTGDVTSRVGRTVVTFTQTLNEKGTQVSKEFPAGTIAITIAANIADTAILGMPMYFPDSVVGTIVHEPNNVRFVELMIRKWKPILEGLAPQSAQKNINLETLRPLAIPTPKPDEQEQIGKLYETIDCDQERLEQTVRKLGALKTGLMHDLLTGNRRVTPLLAAETSQPDV